MTEKTIAKFKYEKNTFKLLEITIEDIGTDGIPTDLKKVKYLIVKNRKRLTWAITETTARQFYVNIITGELLQLHI